MFYIVIRRFSLSPIYKEKAMVRVLHVAEKNDAAKSLARIMSNNSSRMVYIKNVLKIYLKKIPFKILNIKCV